MYKEHIEFWKKEIHRSVTFIKRQLSIDPKLVNLTGEYRRAIQELKEMKSQLKRLEKLQEDYEYSGWQHNPEDQFMFSTAEVHMDIVEA